jgi:EAL domain-containing protein (putative c-di-GMP-specific phosphodiesterase class I)
MTINSTTPPSSGGDSARADVLVVDDDTFVLRAIERMLRAAGYSVARQSDPEIAARDAMAGKYKAILSDIHMPRITGTQMLEVLRSYACDIPVVLMTGAPSFDTAQAAVELGAVQYLTKPVDRDTLLRAVKRALETPRRSQAASDIDPEKTAGFERALGSLWMAFQPIVSLSLGRPIAYEALVRSREPGFLGPGPILDHAEKTQRLPELGRAIRELCADAAANVPRGTSLFVNLHPEDLKDPSLFSSSCPLATYADRVVLEITERSALGEENTAQERIRRLRRAGYRIAIDDLGAGYAGLSSMGLLEPDFVKLDMSLTRDLPSSAVRTRLVASMVEACRDLDMKLVAEGVETGAEREALWRLGLDLLQGYHFAKPAPQFELLAA